MSSVARELAGLPVVVLGAGRGRRMGGPKSLMQVGGEPWWARQHSTLRTYELDPCWVVSEPVAEAMREFGGAPANVVLSEPEAPMFVSVLLGLAGLGSLARGSFILPVDTPAPAVEHWRALVGSTGPAHPCFHGKGGHPLYLPSEWIRDHLQDRLDHVRTHGVSARDHDDRLDALIGPHAERVPVRDPAVTVNLNTPDDLDRWAESRGRWVAPPDFGRSRRAD